MKVLNFLCKPESPNYGSTYFCVETNRPRTVCFHKKKKKNYNPKWFFGGKKGIVLALDHHTLGSYVKQCGIILYANEDVPVPLCDWILLFGVCHGNVYFYSRIHFTLSQTGHSVWFAGLEHHRSWGGSPKTCPIIYPMCLFNLFLN